MFDWIKSIEAILGMFATVVGGTLAALWWFWGRVTGYVDASVKPAHDGRVTLANRDGDLQRQINDLEKRMNSVEKTMEAVARRDDVHEIAVVLAEVRTQSAATAQKSDTLYTAIMDLAQGRRS